MKTDESAQLRARRAHLEQHPHDNAACGGCIFYAPRTDGEGYCAHSLVQLDVGASWWCAYYEKNESSAKFAGHPLHPALIPFPLALTFMALVFDTLAQTTRHARWRNEAKHALIAGTISGLLAAPAGLMDWLALPVDRPAKPYGLVHGLGNLLLLVVNGLNIGLRNGNAPPSPGRRAGEVGLSILANVLALGTGWLGGQLSYRFGVGVEPPTRPYRLLDAEPIVRLPGQPEWRNGSLRVPSEPVWSGPVIPSQPLPSVAEPPAAEERRAAS